MPLMQSISLSLRRLSRNVNHTTESLSVSPTQFTLVNGSGRSRPPGSSHRGPPHLPHQHPPPSELSAIGQPHLYARIEQPVGISMREPTLGEYLLLDKMPFITKSISAEFNNSLKNNNSYHPYLLESTTYKCFSLYSVLTPRSGYTLVCSDIPPHLVPSAPRSQSLHGTRPRSAGGRRRLESP